VRNRFKRAKNGAGFSFRVAYTLSFSRDDGIVNTSDALVAGDFRDERARSLQIAPPFHPVRNDRYAQTSGQLHVSPVLRLASGAPL